MVNILQSTISTHTAHPVTANKIYCQQRRITKAKKNKVIKQAALCVVIGCLAILTFLLPVTANIQPPTAISKFKYVKKTKQTKSQNRCMLNQYLQASFNIQHIIIKHIIVKHHKSQYLSNNTAQVIPV